ncbi:MAG: hypothetical protein HDS72_10555 [Bacteroidales bacterium]|nr:hypothetical protein [Bacteroidales bacterium]
MKCYNPIRRTVATLMLVAAVCCASARSITAPKIAAGTIPSAADVPALLASIAPDSLTCTNWEAFPYLPDVKFRIAHTGRAVLLHFVVNEEAVRGEVTENRGPVYKDSCVEFFVQTDTTSRAYYNFECNCIGTMIVQHGPTIMERSFARPVTLAAIDRWCSLGNGPIALSERPTHWELAMVIPVEAFFGDSITDLSGATMKGNFYKCGDALPHRHYSSWAPISAPRPAFHSPASFAPIYFGE